MREQDPVFFLGYEFGFKGYKVLDLEFNTTSISRNVVFHEDIFPFVASPSQKTITMFDESILPSFKNSKSNNHVLYDDFIFSKEATVVNECVPEDMNTSSDSPAPYHHHQIQLIPLHHPILQMTRKTYAGHAERHVLLVIFHSTIALMSQKSLLPLLFMVLLILSLLICPTINSLMSIVCSVFPYLLKKNHKFLKRQ